jgi:positive regulator of sigma E activity
MDSPEVNNGQEALSLRVAFLHWVACWAILVVLGTLGSFFNSEFFILMAILFYFVAGFHLSRNVLRKLIEWHPMYNTLYNVTSDKLKFFFLWPITYFFLFVRLGINKVL